MLKYLCGFLQGTFFGLFLGFVGGIVASVLLKSYIPEVKAFVERIFEALS
jgi:hypothetical protein